MTGRASGYSNTTAWSKLVPWCPRCQEIVAWRLAHPRIKVGSPGLVLMALVGGEPHLHPHPPVRPRGPRMERVLGDTRVAV